MQVQGLHCRDAGVAAGSGPYAAAVNGADWHFTCACACCSGGVSEASSGCVVSRLLWLPPSTIAASGTLGHATTDGACVPAWCGRGAGALQEGLLDSVHARDINATTLPTGDKAMGLVSIARVPYLLELG
jgi:hypothetical protein